MIDPTTAGGVSSLRRDLDPCQRTQTLPQAISTIDRN
jgi:hypothetical protein